jgi:hypothetical protein
MKKHWLFIGIALITAVFALGAVACGDDDDDGDGVTAPTATVSEAEPTEPEDGETPADGETPEVSAEIAPITMEAVADSGVTGSATMVENAAGGVDVEVTIDGALEYPGTHQSHLHHGNCTDPTGEIHEALTSVEAGADGSGSASTTIDPPDKPDFAHWLSREHYVAVHALDGTVVACGDVLAAS